MKNFFVLLLIAVSFTVSNANAQTAKIGVFDIDVMVQAMPGYRNVDSLVRIYEQDSLTALYDMYATEYNRLDSTFKADSAARKPATVLDYTKNQRTQVGINLVYWQQYSQQLSSGKRQQLAEPLYQRVVTAYSKILQTNNYLVVLKPGAYEMGSKVENVFEKVAKELKVTLPDQLRSGQPTEEKGTPKTTTRPPSKKQ